MHLKLVKRVIFDYVLDGYVYLVKLGELYEYGDLVNYMKLWFGDFFGDDDFFAYTFERMNCICWVD